MTIDDFGGRKFIFAMFAVLCAFLLVALGQLDPKEFITVVTADFAIFASSNAVAHLSDKKCVER